MEYIVDLPDKDITDRKRLVRCKDCKHLFDGESTKNCCDQFMEFTQWTREIDVDLDFYCGYGEPKDGEQDERNTENN